MAANLATAIAATGKRVAIIDTDVQSPGIHVLFGLLEGAITLALNDYLWQQCTLSEAAYDVTPDALQNGPGRVFLVPSSIKLGEIARVLREGYEVAHLIRGINQFSAAYQLDYLLIDTHPGIHEETLLSMAISHELLILLRPDRQDLQGTAVTLQVARSLSAPKLSLIINKLLGQYDPAEVQQQIAEKFQAPVLGVFPMSEDMVRLASEGIFVLKFPHHPYTQALKQVAAAVMTTS